MGEHKPIPHTTRCCQVYREEEKNYVPLFYSHTTYEVLFNEPKLLSKYKWNFVQSLVQIQQKIANHKWC